MEAGQTLWVEVGVSGALNKMVLQREVTVGMAERLDVDETGPITCRKHAHLALYREEDPLALGCHHHYPQIPPRHREEGPRA